MKRLPVASVFAMGVSLLWTGAQLQAQSPYYPRSTYASPYSYNPYNRPTLSPYLNMLRGGNPAANYFLGVIPELERRSDYNQLNLRTLDLERELRRNTEPEDALPTLESTGHPTGFMNYGPYFGDSNPNANPFGNRQGQGYQSPFNRRSR